MKCLPPMKYYSDYDGSAIVSFRYHDSINTQEVVGLRKYAAGLVVYVKEALECDTYTWKFREYRETSNFPRIHDFAFLDDTTFYTYHDYSLKNPDLVYYQVGFNVVYTATHDSVCHVDTSTTLRFTDICGKQQAIKFSVRRYDEVPDTFLVYKNINEDVSNRFILCDKSINTSDNWHKISDYGYIFHYDVYSKEEVESQCPRIREYVEKYR